MQTPANGDTRTEDVTRPGCVASGDIYPEELGSQERKLIDDRRAALGLTGADPHIGVALSGGGIRSATFSLGIFQSLAKSGLLKNVDFLSTVSGGGYFGGFV
ncbi:MAG: hypothetical protein ABI612_13455, partial [Betaproteobacteria bacterium]